MFTPRASTVNAPRNKQVVYTRTPSSPHDSFTLAPVDTWGVLWHAGKGEGCGTAAFDVIPGAWPFENIPHGQNFTYEAVTSRWPGRDSPADLVVDHFQEKKNVLREEGGIIRGAGRVKGTL